MASRFIAALSPGGDLHAIGRGLACRAGGSHIATMDYIEWRVATGLVPYPDALAEMEARAAAIRDGSAGELVWLLEHPPLYTAGTSATAAELIDPDRFPVFATGRGGRHTYHGPGQRVAYVMLDLDRRGRDVRAYVHALEGWAIGALGRLGIAARAIEGQVGIWVDDAAHDGMALGEAKVGAIGVRVRRWVTLHGVAINVAPDLGHFAGIVPCGLAEHPVTSLAAMGTGVAMAALDAALRLELPAFLGRLDAMRHGS